MKGIGTMIELFDLWGCEWIKIKDQNIGVMLICDNDNKTNILFFTFIWEYLYVAPIGLPDYVREAQNLYGMICMGQSNLYGNVCNYYLTMSERMATKGSKFRCSSLHSVSIRRVTYANMWLSGSIWYRFLSKNKQTIKNQTVKRCSIYQFISQVSQSISHQK